MVSEYVCVCVDGKDVQLTTPAVSGGVNKKTCGTPGSGSADDGVKLAKIQRQISLGTSPAPRTSSVHCLMSLAPVQYNNRNIN